MKLSKITPEEVGVYSQLYKDYLQQRPELSGFYNLFPSQENILKQIEQVQFSANSRAVLQSVLNDQYKSIQISNPLKDNIHLLGEGNTYTVTTGHQLNLFTGPLYFIYKIATVIKLAKDLKSKFPQYNFVPVYWMATEDHDFAEINHFNLFNKSFEWKSEEKGAVGRFTTKGIEEVIKEVGEQVPLMDAYLNSASLAEATRKLVNALFGAEGLVVIDGDNAQLKGLFKEEIKQEITKCFCCDLLIDTEKQLADLGYKTQVNPREINLFYLVEGLRERIVKEGTVYKVLNTNLQFSEAELLQLVDSNPERFSPNVVLRPLFEVTVLPDIAYIGGPAEISYWLQLKPVFEYTQRTFPMLIPRLGGLIVSKVNYKKMEKLGLTPKDLFKDLQQLKQEYIAKTEQLDQVTLEEETSKILQVLEEVKAKVAAYDKSLEGYVAAENKKITDVLASVEKRLKKAAEKKNETALEQLASLKAKLFPGDGLQERHDNFLNFYINQPDFITHIFQLDPLDFRFNIIELDD